MALACTATPLAPTPAKPTSSGAFSCMELADKLATAQTETAARVLTSSWNESGCAQKVAGVTKVPTARPTAIPATTMTSREFREFLGLRPAGKTPVPTLTSLDRFLSVPTDCVRVKKTEARKVRNKYSASGYQLLLNWRVENICDVAITTGQTIVIYDKDKSIITSHVEDSAGVLKLLPGESLLSSTPRDYGWAGGDAFHSYEIEVPWKPD